jgi:hypothetical protein
VAWLYWPRPLIGGTGAARLPRRLRKYRATCCGAEAASCARVGRHGNFYSTLSGHKNGRRLRVKQPSAQKIVPVARGPSAHRPAPRRLNEKTKKMLLGAKCSEKGPPRRLVFLGREARRHRAGSPFPSTTASYTRRAHLSSAAPCTSSTPSLSLLLPAPSGTKWHQVAPTPIPPLAPSASPWSSPLAPR